MLPKRLTALRTQEIVATIRILKKPPADIPEGTDLSRVPREPLTKVVAVRFRCSRGVGKNGLILLIRIAPIFALLRFTEKRKFTGR